MKKKDYVEFEQVVERGCGMDVHKATVVATITIEGVAKEAWHYPYCYGEYRYLLETDLQCAWR